MLIRVANVLCVLALAVSALLTLGAAVSWLNYPKNWSPTYTRQMLDDRRLWSDYLASNQSLSATAEYQQVRRAREKMDEIALAAGRWDKLEEYYVRSVALTLLSMLPFGLAWIFRYIVSGSLQVFPFRLLAGRKRMKSAGGIPIVPRQPWSR